jgi:cytochrome c-type biogenesis protein
MASGALLAVVGLLFITGHAGSFMGVAAPVVSAVTYGPEASSAPVTCSAGSSGTMQKAPAVSLSVGGGTPTMLEFVSAHCPICHRMAPVVAKAERDCSAHGVRVQQIDVATPAGREGANRYAILGVPTFIFVDGQGAEVARLVGEQAEETLVQTLEVLAGQSCDGFRRLPASSSPGS